MEKFQESSVCLAIPNAVESLAVEIPIAVGFLVAEVSPTYLQVTPAVAFAWVTDGSRRCCFRVLQVWELRARWYVASIPPTDSAFSHPSHIVYPRGPFAGSYLH